MHRSRAMARQVSPNSLSRRLPASTRAPAIASWMTACSSRTSGRFPRRSRSGSGFVGVAMVQQPSDGGGCPRGSVLGSDAFGDLGGALSDLW